MYSFYVIDDDGVFVGETRVNGDLDSEAGF